MTEIEFQRTSDTPDGFDGRWTVWVGTRSYGVVRKSSDPLRRKEPWGFESRTFGRYGKGVTCEQGFRTRKLAAEAMIERMPEREEPTADPARTVPDAPEPPVGLLDEAAYGWSCGWTAGFEAALREQET